MPPSFLSEEAQPPRANTDGYRGSGYGTGACPWFAASHGSRWLLNVLVLRSADHTANSTAINSYRVRLGNAELEGGAYFYF